MTCRNAGWGRIESGRSIRQGKGRLVSDRLEGILEGVVSLATARCEMLQKIPVREDVGFCSAGYADPTTTGPNERNSGNGCVSQQPLDEFMGHPRGGNASPMAQPIRLHPVHGSSRPASACSRTVRRHRSREPIRGRLILRYRKHGPGSSGASCCSRREWFRGLP